MLTKLKSRIIKSIRNKKLNVFGLFLVLTFVFSALTKLSKTYTDNITLDIRYVNLPEQDVITLDSLPKINATVSAFGFDLLWYQFRKHTIQIDFEKDVYIKDSTYVWIASKFKNEINNQLGNSAEVVSLEKDTLRFPFETLIVKKVPVILNSKVVFKTGYDILDSYTIRPDSVNVIGSALEVSKISKVETELLSMKDVIDTINKTLVLMKPENPNVKFSTNEVSVSVKVEKFTEGTLEVPVTIINKPLDVPINYFPKTVTVLYYTSLNSYKTIKPLDFKVDCDFAETENTNKAFFVPKLVKIPKEVKSARLKQNKVEFIITR